MTQATLWWLAAGALVAAELLTGTFYLLMVALGLAAAAVSAHLGLVPAAQWVAAALVGSGSVLIWYLSAKKSRPEPALTAVGQDINLDIGATVQVEHFNPDGSCSTQYRGAHWDAVLASGEVAQAGYYTVVDIVGSRLVLKSSYSSGV